MKGVFIMEAIAEENKNEVYIPYVRQDIFNSELKFISSQMSNMEKVIITKIEAINTKIETLDKRIDDTNRRIDDMNQVHSKLFTLFGVMLTVLSVMLAAIPLLK